MPLKVLHIYLNILFEFERPLCIQSYQSKLANTFEIADECLLLDPSECASATGTCQNIRTAELTKKYFSREVFLAPGLEPFKDAPRCQSDAPRKCSCDSEG